MTTFRFSLTLLAATSLQACTEKVADEGLICDPSPGFIEDAAPTGDAQLARANSCIHKWAYRFGRAPGSNDEIASAVIGKCRDAIDGTLALKVDEGNKAKQPFTDDVWQLYVKRLNETALYRVVQGRAGKCSIRGPEQR